MAVSCQPTVVSADRVGAQGPDLLPADLHPASHDTRLEHGRGTGRRATLDGAVVQAEPAAVQRALDAAVDHVALVQRTAPVGAPVAQDVQPVALAQQSRGVSATVTAWATRPAARLSAHASVHWVGGRWKAVVSTPTPRA